MYFFPKNNTGHSSKQTDRVGIENNNNGVFLAERDCHVQLKVKGQKEDGETIWEVVVTHKPTGIQVACSEADSQLENLRMARGKILTILNNCKILKK